MDVSAATRADDGRAYAIADLDDAQVYTLLSAAVQPRPIAWVATVDRDGLRNLAPFSFFNVASRKPPTLMLSIGERIGLPQGGEAVDIDQVRRAGAGHGLTSPRRN
ncbi:hypothetical protein [Nocardia vinacea]|uniref:hypothetical protein n=1 Tax=Nocardia vinacea TaxID=96468 RepID=UPI00030EAFEC|nr:hypothetical protein [Nocardia vinacea]